MRNTFATLFVAALALADTSPLATFKFDGSSDTAAIKGQVRYEAGLQGKALVLGDATATIPCPQKLTPAEGTLTLWVKPLNWDMGAKEFVSLVQSLSPDKSHRLLLYKYTNPGLGLTFWLGAVTGEKSQDNRYANHQAASLPKGEWTRLAITWSRKAGLLALNVNGVQVASASYSERMTFPAFGDFVLNAPPFRPANRGYETAFDLVQFYGSALSEEKLARTYENERGGAAEVPIALLRQTVLTVPTLAGAPKLDGSFEAPEWAGAAQAGCFTTLSKPQLVLRPSTDAYIGHHDEKLYFCFIGKIPNATTLVSEVTKRDGSVYADDAYEIHLRPPEMPQGYYQGIFNSIDTIYDSKTGDASWNADWQIKNGIYEGQWICEIALPLKEVGSRFAEGACWKFNLCRDRKVFPEILFSSVSPSAMPFFAHYGDLRLTTQGCYGRLSLDYERLFARSLELKFTAGNCGGQPRQATILLEKFDASGALLDTQTRGLTIPGQGSAETVWEDPLTGFRSGFLRLTAKEADGTVFHRQDLPLVFKDEVNILTETNLEQATLRCSVDMSSHYRLAETATAIAELRPESGKAVSLRLEGKPVARGVFDLVPIPPGDCTITVRFLDNGGRELLTAKQPYKHIGQPRWLVEKPGENAGVVWPYTPIRREGDSLNVWGRSHRLGDALLPAQITSQGTPLFTAPPALIATIDGRRSAFTEFRFRPVQLDGARATCQFSATAEKLLLDG
ncbi:MAG: hypothetical protein IJJ33_02050, partial [Victivallales bacterium]|nr:hypothetical protein [Victivallales bacterium]